ncbi:MAG: SIMPL domain-containing protein [Candidatus Shapirobacteria bacterium]
MENQFSNRYKYIFLSLVFIITVTNIFNLSKQNFSSITVVGQGNITATPGEVSMIVTRATIGNSTDEAVSQGEEIMSKLINVVQQTVGDKVEIKKSFFQVTPQNDGKYLMANAISIKTSNISVVSNLIKNLYSSGATTVSSVTFSPADDGVSENKSREVALKDARRKADDMAKTMGKKVGKIISIAEDTANLNSSIGDGLSSNSDIGSISMEKRVSVVYEIK